MSSGVGFLGLSGYEVNDVRVAKARRYFEARGMAVTLAPSLEQSEERFAASRAARLAALDEMASNEEPGLVMALRGGYGISRLLDAIDFGALATKLRRHRKTLVGHSDWTGLSLALFARTHFVSLAGPMAAPDFGVDEPDPFTAAQFWDALESGCASVDWECESADTSVRGTLWGGNLSMLCSLVGTPYLPAVRGGILFLEDTNEHPYRIERMLLQLSMAGVLSSQAAIVLGDFDAYRTLEYDRGYDLASVITLLRERLRIPVLSGLPFGHLVRKATLPVGASAELAVSGGRAHLRAPVAERPHGA